MSEDLHKNSSQTNQIDSEKEVNTKQVVLIIFLFVLVVVGAYFFKFHFQLSDNNEVWGTFGDYVGGILNPVIAAFAFYLIAKSYELQRRELGETTKLLKVSTDAQEKQIKVAALTALLNSNLTRIGLLKSEKIELSKIVKSVDPKLKESVLNTTKGSYQDGFNKGFCQQEEYDTIIRIGEIDSEINKMSEANVDLERQIDSFINV